MATVDLYQALRDNHDLQRSLCKRLLKTKPRTQERQQLFTELRIELEAHAAAEERYLYVVMLLEDRGLSASRHALAEHHKIEELIEELRVVDLAQRGWLAKARKLSETVHHHLREEEKKFFQLSGKILTDAQKKKLGKQYLADYERMKAKLAAA